MNITELPYPKTEKTLIKHGYRIGLYKLVNDMGHPCEYRVTVPGVSNTLGVVKYFKGRFLAVFSTCVKNSERMKIK